MQFIRWYHPALVALLLGIIPAPAFGQTPQSDIVGAINRSDSLFWNAYNRCDLGSYQESISGNVEFYHDRSGMTQGLDNLLQETRDNLCNGSGTRLRREALEGTIQVFVLQNDAEIYGAVMTGEHLFFVSENGEPERADGLAKFTHVWLLEGGAWKIARILSYDHGPAPYINRRQDISLSNAALDRFVGKYEGPRAGPIIVQREGNSLTLTFNGNQKVILHAETGNRFFLEERDLTFEFVESTPNETLRMLVRENGAIVEEAPFSP